MCHEPFYFLPLEQRQGRIFWGFGFRKDRKFQSPWARCYFLIYQHLIPHPQGGLPGRNQKEQVYRTTGTGTAGCDMNQLLTFSQVINRSK